MDRNQLEIEFNKMLDQMISQVDERRANGELSKEDADSLLVMIANVVKPTQHPDWDVSDYWTASSQVC